MSISSFAISEFEPIIAAAIKSAVVNYFTTRFNATVAADVSKLIDDGLALAQTPGLSAGVADLPDFFKALEDILAKYVPPAAAA